VLVAVLYYTLDMDNAKQCFWDPLNQNIDISTYIAEQTDLANKLQGYRDKPYRLKVHLAFLILLPITVAILILFLRPVDIGLAMYTFIPFITYRLHILNIEGEFILFLLCEKNMWPYNPNKDINRPIGFADLLPGIFNYGSDRNFEEQIWGTIQGSNNKTSFWRGVFHFTTGYGRSQRLYTEDTFIFQLSDPIPVNFSLAKAGIFGESEKHIETESEEFNKAYRIISDNNDEGTQMQIIKILSPSVQTRMIDFSKKYTDPNIYFCNNLLAIVFNKEVLEGKYTNFFRKVGIDQRDVDRLNTAILDMAELRSEMVQFI